MRHAHCIFAVGLLLATTTSLRAQTQPSAPETGLSAPHVMVGFVVNGPHQFIGAGAAWLPSFLRGWGLYLDYKTDSDSPADAESFLEMSVQEALATGDQHRLRERSYTSVNAAVVRSFGSNVVMYLGGGVSDRRVYHEFFDPSGERGVLGLYWAEEQEAGGPRANLLGGLFFRLAPKIAVQFGAEAVPAGATVGLHLAL